MEKLESLINELKIQGISDKKVLDAIKKIPRHFFVKEEFLHQAYENYPLPVDDEQTISQPYTTAIMLEALELKKNDKVLEIGTASGWSSALIAEIVKPGKVYTVEIIKKLVDFAKNNLKKINLKNITVVHGDGSLGYKKEAPFDKIVVTAGCPEIPKPLIKQLKDKGILVAPVGPFYGQKMLKVRKIGKELDIENLGDFVFVKLKGKYGHDS